MHAEFWHRCWSDSDIGFHEEQANPFLVRYLPGRLTAPDSRIFLPLCGKTSSIAWLLARGYRVVGVELSPIAIEQLFEALGIEPRVSIVDDLVHYQADNLDLYVGDFFALTPELLGQVDATFDRGALVALPTAMRERYATQLQILTCGAPQLLIAFEYQQILVEGPPFSVSSLELHRHYGSTYQLAQLESVDRHMGFTDVVMAESAWWLSPKASAGVPASN